jgi:hypothetical protein
LAFREVSELNIETIEDVTSQNVGVFGNILNYGTVFIQTAGAAQRFEFHNVPHPGEIASLILQLYEAHSNTSKEKVAEEENKALNLIKNKFHVK